MAPPVHRYGRVPDAASTTAAHASPRASPPSAGPKAQYCKSCDEPIKAATDVAYDCIKEKLLRIVNTKFGSGKLILVGGIQINLPKPYEDHFQPKFFQVLGEGCAPVDLLPELAPPAPKKD